MSETPDQAATRRRWITLAEVVAVAGVVIAGLTLWTSWSDRRAERADRIAEEHRSTQEKQRFIVSGIVHGGASITIDGDADHAIKDVGVRFPSALGVAEQRPADFTITRDMFEPALLKITDKGPDAQTGRLPVLLDITYWNGDAPARTSGIYDIVWRTEGRILRGRSLTLEALRLRQRGGSQASLDAAWAAERRQ